LYEHIIVLIFSYITYGCYLKYIHDVRICILITDILLTEIIVLLYQFYRRYNYHCDITHAVQGFWLYLKSVYLLDIRSRDLRVCLLLSDILIL